MPSATPLECPACGHDRIGRRPSRRASDARSAGLAALPVVEWMCHLCSYTWNRPTASRRAFGELE